MNHSCWNTSGDKQPPLRWCWFVWRLDEIQARLWNILWCIHCLSYLSACTQSPSNDFFSLFWPKDVCFALRHWTNNQPDLRVGLGFLQAVILRVLLRHKHHLLTPVSMEKRVKNSFFCFFFNFCGRMQINKISTVCATAITKMCTVGQILKEPTAYNHSSFFSPLCLSEDT